MASNDPLNLKRVLADIPMDNVELDALDFSQGKEKDLFAVHKHKAWDKSVEARCDFTMKVRFPRRAGVRFLSIWEKSLYGRTLTDIKGDDAMVEFFAVNVAPAITEALGGFLHNGGWAVCTTPKRRHLTKNFASRIAERLAELLGIPFYEDVATCRSKHRVGAIFDLNVLPRENNLIVFDDFVTMGSTLQSMRNLLVQHEKNLFFVTGINNIM